MYAIRKCSLPFLVRADNAYRKNRVLLHARAFWRVTEVDWRLSIVYCAFMRPVRPQSIDDCTPEEWDRASRAACNGPLRYKMY